MAKRGDAQSGKKGSPWILVSALLGFALVLGGFGVHKFKLGKASASWPSVAGTVTYSHAESRRGSSKTEYLPAVKYSYTVAGKSYLGGRISSSEVYKKNLASANGVLRNYPVGRRVTVYYDPADPSSSLLVPGVPRNLYLLLGGAVLCLLLGVAVAVSALKNRGVPA